jgi:crossover junction endodeoxyribonuclease RuvC
VRILGVDCGSRFTGYGIIETGLPRHRLIVAGVVKTKTRDTFPERLLTIAQELRAVLAEYRPEEAAVEETFYSPNSSSSSSLRLTHVRGAVLLVLAEAGLKVGEYPPARVKLAVTGNGRAEKVEVQSMVRILLNLSEPIASFDASDAVAVALCHAAMRTTEVLR